MNNEQSNNILGGLNPNPSVEPNSNALHNVPNGTSSNTESIPGANLSLIGGENNNSNLAVPNSQEINSHSGATIPISPIPGMAEKPNEMLSVETNNSSGAVSDSGFGKSGSLIGNPEILPVDSNSVVPNSEAPTNSELKIDVSSPFDIGIGAQNTNNNLSLQTNNSSMVSGMNSVEPLVSSIPQTGGEIASETIHSGSSSISTDNSVNTNLDNFVAQDKDNVPLTSTTPNATILQEENVVSVGKYILTLILFSIPIVGFIMIIVKAFADKKDKNITNLARAYLVLSVIVTVFFGMIFIAFGAMLTNFIPEDSSSTNVDYDYDYDYDYNLD